MVVISLLSSLSKYILDPTLVPVKYMQSFVQGYAPKPTELRSSGVIGVRGGKQCVLGGILSRTFGRGGVTPQFFFISGIFWGLDTFLKAPTESRDSTLNFIVLNYTLLYSIVC